MYGGNQPYGNQPNGNQPYGNNPVGQQPFQGQNPVQMGSMPYQAMPVMPAIDQQVQQVFNNADSQRMGRINADQLQNALRNNNFTSFDMQVVQLMIQMFDTDQVMAEITFSP